jgi:hypothetical protein
MKKFILVIVASVMILSGCDVATGLLLTSGGEGTSQTQPTEKLNYFNYGDRQECLDRGLEWKTVRGRKVCM